VPQCRLDSAGAGTMKTVFVLKQKKSWGIVNLPPHVTGKYTSLEKCAILGKGT
jgi:hypothetical protein